MIQEKDHKSYIDVEQCFFQAVYKKRPLQYFKEESVAKLRFELGNRLGDIIPKEKIKEIDFICPVPNTGTYYAMGFSWRTGTPYLQALIKEAKNEERSFQILDIDKRKMFLWSRIKPIKEFLIGKNVALIDEAIFTGATLKVVVEMLIELGTNSVNIFIPTPLCYNRCPFSVMPDRVLLLEYINKRSLREYFNVQDIYFQSRENFESYLELFNDEICAKCFGGG